MPSQKSSLSMPDPQPTNSGKSQSRHGIVTGIAVGSSGSETQAAAVEIPAGAPDWVTSELIELTIRTWQPYYRTPLSPDDALTMILNVGRLYGVLSREPGS